MSEDQSSNSGFTNSIPFAMTFRVRPVRGKVDCDSVDFFLKMIFNAVYFFRKHLVAFGNYLQLMAEVLCEDADMILKIFVDLLPEVLSDLLQFNVYLIRHLSQFGIKSLLGLSKSCVHNRRNHFFNALEIFFFHSFHPTRDSNTAHNSHSS